MTFPRRRIVRAAECYSRGCVTGVNYDVQIEPNSSQTPLTRSRYELGGRRSISPSRSVQLPFAIVSTGKDELGKRGIPLHKPCEIWKQRRLRVLELLIGLVADQQLPAGCTLTVVGRLQIRVRWVVNHVTRF